jgi:hypothetical protein
MASSEEAPEDNHQARMARYLDSASCIILESLYFLQRRLCWSCMSSSIYFWVSFQRCSPVEETSALSVLHGDLWITTAIDGSNSIPIGLCTFRHEAFEVGILDAVRCHEIVEFSPHDTLDLRVFRLHVTYGDGHDLAIRCIVYVTRHCGPFFDTLDKVKHEPSVLEISSWLHALDEVHTTSRFVFQHLEDVHLVLALTWKDVAVDILNCGVRFHSHDAIICSPLATASTE